MSKRLMLIATFVLAICNIVKADDIVTISDLKISAGETKEVNISLENEAEYVAFQFDLYLPEGITLEVFSADRSRIPETSTLDMYQQSDGSYRFILAAVGGKPMSGNNGSIVTLTVKASESLAFGENTGCFRKIKLSKADATGPTYSEMSFPITVIEPSVVTVTSVSREYGNDNPVFEYTVTGGALNGTPEITCNASASSVVGEYPISISRGSVTNFNVTFVDGTLTVMKAPLTVTAKSYTIKQGEVLPAFEATYSGFRNGETSAVLTTQPTITTTATSASAPGTYDINASGAVAQNYDISYVKGTLTVVAAEALVVTANSYTITYGDALPTFEYTSSGATISGTPTITCTATSTSPVGTYPITISKGSVTNYNDSYVNGTLTITKAPLTITAKSYTKKQGEENPAFEVEYSGFKNGETASVLTTQPTVTCSATAASELGSYDITVSGATAANYNISYVKGTLTIVAADALVVTANSYTITYGDALPTFEYTSSSATISGTPTITCTATSTSPVGTYPITISKGSVTNYNDSYVNGTLTITKAPLTITAKSYTKKQGEENPAFEVEYSGFKNGETSAALTTQPTFTTTATSASAPDTYDITVSGAVAQNYNISYVKGTLTVVAAEALVVTANSYTITYGDALPTFEYTSSGATISGTPTITCTATSTSPVGTYPITISKGSVTNYNDSYVNGTLTITKAPLTITAKSYTKKQGEENPAFEVEYSGFKNGETASVLTTQPTISCSATSSSSPGTYNIIVSGGSATNYAFSYVNGTLTIEACINNIQFADNTVKSICVANWDTNGDHELSKDEAAAVTDIGEVFRENEEITSFNELKYFTGLTKISEAAFFGDYALKSVELPAGLTSIEHAAFGICSSLTSIFIPKNVTSINGTSFRDCTSLVEITVDGENPVYESPRGCNAIINKNTKTLVTGCKVTVVPDGVEIIGPSAFYGQYSIKELVLPASVKQIGYGSYDGCGFETLVIPNTVERIDYAAFWNCHSLTTIKLPAKTPALSSEICSNCMKLREVISLNPNPTAISDDVFIVDFDGTMPDATLYVPNGSKAKYEATAGWKRFTKIVEADLMDPIEKGEKVDFEEVGSGTDLAGNIVDDVFINIPVGDGSYDAEDKCLVVTKVSNDATVNKLVDKDPMSDEVKNGFSGVIFKVPAGEGNVKVEAESTGGMTLKVKIGKAAPVEIALTGKASMKFPYDVPEPTYVYIYAGQSAAARGIQKTSTAGSLKLYSVAVERATGIGDLNSDSEIDVTDVVELIDMVLAGSYDKAGDINEDGEVDVTDVVELIDMVLAGE